MAKFQSGTGGHVSVYVDWQPDPIELPEDGEYETADRREIEALRACPEAVEVRVRKAK